jgi:hypothetical protein
VGEVQMQGNRMGIGRKFKGLYGAINALTGDYGNIKTKLGV